MFPKRFLYRFSFPCPRVETLWTPQGTTLDESHRLPELSSLDDQESQNGGIVDFRVGWNEKGVAFSVRVDGKKRRPWCRATRPEDSDGVQLYIDTRDVRNVHRATRYCHRLFLLPGGSGPNQSQPTLLWLPINRAKAHPNPVPVERLKIGGQITDTMYRLDVVIPGDALTGYEPHEHSRIGLYYMIVDQEIGNRPFLVGFPFPYSEDPSLWATLELMR